ncbi:DEAD/DEAH box helicase family protein [Mycolicibacterium farcinogenes]|uniref:DEAD/DEAH box helicase n=1 Tax=Mycolicibacterium farcinogenes TaxID=1802 RepID=UPI001C8E9BB9|nr:DEAD/DEAH box helicase family protein [Mycolicibacterium farcinogenes]QZH61406.1 DEAD/DEAH box helicase family protein [Mycolicibacterium farcinogenes]
MTPWSPGISFADVLRESDIGYVRALLGEPLCRLVDLLGDGSPNQVRAVAASAVDLETLLKSADRRAELFKRISPAKLAELADRLDMPAGSDHIDRLADLAWTSAQRRIALEFFGLVVEDVPPSAPDLCTAAADYGLFPHQRVAAREIRDLLYTSPRRGVLHLPTGVGKTRTAMNLVCDHLRAAEPSIVVWLARGRELLEQAATEFGRAWSYLGNRPVKVARVWGAATLAEMAFTDGLLVLSVDKAAAMVRADPDCLARLSSAIRLVVFDEAHQVIAPTYQRVVDDLTLHPETSLLGLTATPGRTWADIDKDGRLADYFARQKVILHLEGFSNPVSGLIELGYLARPTFRTVTATSGLELSHSDKATLAEAFDIPASTLAMLETDEQWNLLIVRTVLDLLSSHNRILVFAATVHHCRVLASLLTALGVDADYVTGTSSPRQRGRAISRFTRASARPMVLFNYGVLTTGFDVPAASAAVIARPTQSLVLYSQMVGRVLRGPLAGGTDTCEIVTVVDTALPGFGDVAEAFVNWEDVWETS